MFRVYNNEKKRWIRDKVCMTPEGELLAYNHSILGWVKLSSASQDNVYHRDIGLYDKNNILIFEGDFLKAEVAEGTIVRGIVVFAEELSAYIILCDNTNEYFTLGTEVCEYIEVIGNVFDGYIEEKYNEESSEQAL